MQLEIDMKMYDFLTDRMFNVRWEHGHQNSIYGLREDVIVGVVGLGSDDLKNSGHAHAFLILVQISNSVKTVPTSNNSVTFKDTEDKEQIQDEALFYQQKLGLVERRNVLRLSRHSRQ